MILATVIAVVLAAPALIATAAIYAAARGRRGDAGTAPLPLRALLVAFGREWLAALALMIAAPFPVRVHSSHASRRIAVLVPERYCSSNGFWYLRRRLRASGWQCVPGLRRNTGGNAAKAFAVLDACIARLPADCELVLIGHGVGGLFAHRYAQQRPTLPIRHVITLAAPHQGSGALPYRLLGGAEQSEAGSSVSDAVAVDVIAIYSDFDAWLVPVDDAYCPGGFNIAVRGLGHCAMLLSRRVADLIAENLVAPAPANTALEHPDTETSKQPN